MFKKKSTTKHYFLTIVDHSSQNILQTQLAKLLALLFDITIGIVNYRKILSSLTQLAMMEKRMKNFNSKQWNFPRLSLKNTSVETFELLESRPMTEKFRIQDE